jgi:DNA-binding MarR family transcriptional regulator
MEIEKIIKVNSPIGLTKKTILNVLYTNNCLTEKTLEVFKKADLSAEQYNVLRILRGQKGNPINMGDIQERMLAKSSNTTRLVDKLLLKKFVKRKICKNNRRKMEITITNEGLTLLQQIDPLIDAIENQFAANLSYEELIQLNLLLEKFRTLN